MNVILIGIILGLISVVWTACSGVPFPSHEFTTQAGSTFGWLILWSIIANMFFGDH